MAKIRILVGEDESLVAKDIRNMLKSLGYDVVGVVSTGEEAVRQAEAAVPDLVLLDIVLKGEIDGVVAAQRIWEIFSIPVIYLTAYADEITLERAKVTEPFGYILKPFDERELQTTIEIAYYKAKMDKALREREEWLSTILRSIGDGVIVADQSDRVAFMNPLAEKLTGWEQRDALQRSLQEIFPLAEDIPIVQNMESDIFKEGLLRARTGTMIPVEQTVSPIQAKGEETIGSVLVFRDITRRRQTEADLKQSWTRLQKALAGTVQALAQVIELRDPYTAGHQRRVGKLSSAIARDMGFPPDQVEGIRMAADIHDIGKIYVPTEILSKPGKITEIEYSIIKTHAHVGYDILKSIEFPWPIAQIIHEHHERMDGSGYPNRLSGDKILLEARIIGVADVVEAMSSHRPYRPSHGVDKALEEIGKNRGHLYDPTVVDICARLFNENKFSFE